MAVTKLIAFVIIVSSIGCAVDLSTSTPGASSGCTATSQQLTDFTPVLNNILQSTGTVGGGKQACGTCHNNNSTNSGKNTFTIFPGDTTANSSLILSNFCQVKRLGRRVADEPEQTNGHGGGQYLATEIQDLHNFVYTNFQN